MTDDALLVLGFVSVTFGFIAFFKKKAMTANREILSTKQFSIPLGRPEPNVDGQLIRVRAKIARGESLLVSPISRKSCVYHRVVVERDQGVARTQKVLDQKAAVSFWLNDGEGEIYVELIDANHVAVVGLNATMEQSGRIFGPHPFVERQLQAAGIELQEDGFTGPVKKIFHHVETTVCLGDEIELTGRARWVDGKDSDDPSQVDYRETHFSKRLMIYASDEDPVQIIQLAQRKVRSSRRRP